LAPGADASEAAGGHEPRPANSSRRPVPSPTTPSDPPKTPADEAGIKNPFAGGTSTTRNHDPPFEDPFDADAKANRPPDPDRAGKRPPRNAPSPKDPFAQDAKPEPRTPKVKDPFE
jgi:hypothetical protein